MLTAAPPPQRHSTAPTHSLIGESKNVLIAVSLITDPARIATEKELEQCAKLEDSALDHEQHIQILHSCGVTVEFLLEFTFAHDCWDKPTWWVNRHIIKPATFNSRCRFAHLPG